jgi:hypothetical protein
VVPSLLLLAACGKDSTLSGGAPVGSACERAGDCAEECFPPGDLFPDGLCTRACLDGTCPPGSICLTFADYTLCFAECTGPGDCREGYGCSAEGACVPCTLDPPACMPPADADADGDRDLDVVDEGPEPEAGDADADSPPEAEAEPGADADADADAGPLDEGDPCTASAQCRSRLCLPPELGGVCADRCSPDDDCAYGYSCVPFAEDTDGNGLTDTLTFGCYDWPAGAAQDGLPCTDDATCRSHLCRQWICTRLCLVAEDCPPVSACRAQAVPLGEGSASYDACAFDPVTASEVRIVSLGNQRLPTGSEGRAGAVWIPSMMGGISMVLLARQRGTTGGYVGFLDVYDPAETHVFGYEDFVEGRDTPNWHMPDSRIGAFFLPNTDRVVFYGGRYTYTPVFFPPDETTSFTDTIDYTLYVKFDPAGGVTGRLDANLFFVGSDNVDASTAPSSSRFQNALREWERVYGGSGITVGNYTYNAVDAAAAERYRVVDYGEDIDSVEVGGILSLSSGRTEHAVNVFFVHDFAGYGLLGVAGGIPGPPAVHGTTHSGVIVNLDGAWDYGPGLIGQVVAHEVGHYLGLFHATENPEAGFPYSGDPIGDTWDGDSSNLMYWYAGGDRLSDTQSAVMRRCPTVLPP